MNIIIAFILIRNRSIESMKIFRNFRLNRLVELQHFDALFVNSQFSKLTIRRFKSKHNHSFFQMIFYFAATCKNFDEIEAFVAINNKNNTKVENIILHNEIIIHKLINDVIQQFFKLVNDYSTL